MEHYLLISEAAKEVMVESHVLRYWEEELHLPIKRNEMGHRYYTQDDIARFKQIKGMKERGLQLKAIKMILKDGRLDMLSQSDMREETEMNMQQEMEKLSVTAEGESKPEQETDDSSVTAEGGSKSEQEIGKSLASTGGGTKLEESREEKAQRLQWILQQLIRQAMQENNQELVREIKDSVLKELDYQFRMQEEREEERARVEAERTECYYQKIDELLRQKSRGRGNRIAQENARNNKKLTLVLDKQSNGEKQEKNLAETRLFQKKKKRHFLF